MYRIDERECDALVSTFNDRSPIHVDQAYAEAAGFPRTISHGAILQGFLSHFIGMYFPGKRSLILSVNMDYRRPSFIGDEVRLVAQVRQKVESGQVVVLVFRFMNTSSKEVVASGKAQVAMRNE
ncbi:MAG: MaoC/PaaZ C-terminal domain-containing protein [Pyrinomonadaceae bacterium]